MTAPPISILIPVLNDSVEVNATIKSIRDTAGLSPEIVVVDDGSEAAVVLDDKFSKLIRNESRIGSGKSRHLAAENATSEYILSIDSHMRFQAGWLEQSLKRLATSENTIWCAACPKLNDGNMDLTKVEKCGLGARLLLYDGKRIFEGVWESDRPNEDDYEIPCLMGAGYFMRRDWFLKIGGLKHNIGWGSTEPFLSLKTWLAGGEIRLMKSVKIGHKFKEKPPYYTEASHIFYNKIRAMKVLLPSHLFDFLVSKIPNPNSKKAALDMIQGHAQSVQDEIDFYKSIFVNSFEWFENKFKPELVKT